MIDIILIIIAAIALVIIYAWLFMKQPKFGRRAEGTDHERILESPNYKQGSFQNIHDTPDITEGATYGKLMKDFIFGRSKRSKPASIMPSIKTDLLHLDPAKDIVVWFGHSSYFLQIDGKRILVDPVFSGAASPIRITTRAFKGADIYSVDDFPVIDYLFITHDHWDHLDYKTVKKLQPKVKKVITGLGTGSHLRYWGYDRNIVIEKDWNEEVKLDDGFIVNTTSARHFSGRGFKRNQAMWLSFVLQTPSKKIFLGGDSGYDTHFKEIGDKFGLFDLAILECGQYNKYWKYIHTMPEETVHAGIDLKAKNLMPVHWGKFSLALHAWDESIQRFVKESEAKNINVVTPMIGEEVDLNKIRPFAKWWEQIK